MGTLNVLSTIHVTKISRKSQVAIEFAYRFKDAHQDVSVFWVFGGSIPRFYEGYKKIAQGLALPGWDDPDVPIMNLVTDWLNQTTSPYLLILDNADDMLYYWPNKYKSATGSDEPATNLASHLPEKGGRGKVLITSRDSRIAGRLSNPNKPIALPHMNTKEAIELFRSDLEMHGFEATEDEMTKVVEALDCLPLAITQAASFIDENSISVAEYLEALEGDDAEEFLQEELDDSRRDEDSINSVFRSWKLSFERISKLKPRAAEFLSLLGMLDRQSIPKWLVKVPESITSAGVLQAFSLIFCPSGSDSFQLHRLCQRFVRLWLKRANELQKWQDAALRCVSQAYPTEIGLKEWQICDMLAPHVATVLEYEYQSTEARLDLASLLCWAADFDVERGLYGQALARAKRSLGLFRELVPHTDERLASSMWLYGRLIYYEARSQSDLLRAQETLREALSISNPSVYIFAECAFELAHLSFALDEEEECLKMGKASYECWKSIEGIGDVRTLDNQHDYALELAMFGHYDKAIANWQEILDLCPKSNASADTKSIYMYRSMASMAEFRGDASTAEILYAKLVNLGSSIYGEQHVHVFDYKLSHAEQLLRLNRLKEAFESCQSTLRTCVNKSEWRIPATCYEIMAECCKLEGDGAREEEWRRKCSDTHSKHLEGSEKEGTDALEAAARCLLNNKNPQQAEAMFQKVITWREAEYGPTHASTLEAVEFLGICKVYQGLDVEAEAAFDRAASHTPSTSASASTSTALYNLCTTLWNQQKWDSLEKHSRQALAQDPESELASDLQKMLFVALDRLGRSDDSLASTIGQLSVGSSRIQQGSRLLPRVPTGQTSFPPRFGRIIHPRTWSA